jgi:two-component system, chemotaxis family, protein-glutamate methylesterase/glutaminase
LSIEPQPVPPLPLRVVAIGTSAGGLDALTRLLAELPPGFALPVLIVQHLARDHRSHLAELLQPHTRLEVTQARGGELVRAGRAYIAPPDRHMEVDSLARIRIRLDPPVSFSRPSVDVLFDSVAHAFGRGGVAVVLTGAGSDGSRGVRAIHGAGGLVIAQDQESSRNFGMPHAAIATGVVDHVLPLAGIARFLTELGPDLETLR